jgi:threonylcarbamoyladenosine tRNA methylthiotransferase MtaB
MPHFHIPLQSGSDEILKGMRRRYRTDLYRERIASIKSAMPHACIGVDVIVGFPGETNEYFNETVEFLKDLDVSYLHVFTYSERANTTALRIEDIVPMEIRNERNKILRLLSAKKRAAFDASFKGTEAKVLWESVNDEGKISGFTENYIKVIVPFDETLSNCITTITI